MKDAPVSYGEDQYDDLSMLRAVVWEIAEGRCEHPDSYTGRCHTRAVELAHIVPRGHGGSRYRNTVNNTMAACRIHARSTDDLSSDEWDHVRGWSVRDKDDRFNEHLLTKRQALTKAVLERRQKEGWAV